MMRLDLMKIIFSTIVFEIVSCGYLLIELEENNIPGEPTITERPLIRVTPRPLIRVTPKKSEELSITEPPKPGN